LLEKERKKERKKEREKERASGWVGGTRTLLCRRSL